MSRVSPTSWSPLMREGKTDDFAVAGVAQHVVTVPLRQAGTPRACAFARVRVPGFLLEVLSLFFCFRYIQRPKHNPGAARFSFRRKRMAKTKARTKRKPLRAGKKLEQKKTLTFSPAAPSPVPIPYPNAS